MRRFFGLLMPLALIVGAPVLADTSLLRSEPAGKQLARLVALTPQSVSDQVVIRDDELEPIVEIATSERSHNGDRFTDRVRTKSLLRVFIDKRSGMARFQLYMTVLYSMPLSGDGSERRNFQSASFLSDGGPQSVSLDLIDNRIGDCPYQVCLVTEIVGLKLSEAQLREIAAKYVPGSPVMWRFRLKARNGLHWEDRITYAEAAGLLIALDRYRAAHRMSQ